MHHVLETLLAEHDLREHYRDDPDVHYWLKQLDTVAHAVGDAMAEEDVADEVVDRVVRRLLVREVTLREMHRRIVQEAALEAVRGGPWR